MIQKIMYFFSNEYREKVKRERCEEVRNNLRNLDLQYNQFRKIEFTNNVSTVNNKLSYKIGFIVILLQLFVFGAVGYFLVKAFMRASININYVSLIIVGLCFLIFVLGIWERKKDISRTVNKIELDNTIFKVFSLDGKEVEYNFESIDIETRAMKDKDSNISTTKYLLYIKEATQKKKKIFYVNTYGVLNEFLAFYNYLGYIKKGIQYEELEDNQVLEMIHEATYGKKENVALAKYKALLILGYAFLFLIGACFFNIGMRFYSLIKLDKVQAVVTNFEDWSYLGNDLNWVKDTNVKVTYEYKDKEYTKILYNDQYFGNKVGNKKSIYVNPDNPEFFDYFHLGIDEVSIIFGFGVLAYVFLFMYKKKVNELDLNK